MISKKPENQAQYERMKKEYICGWNTWNTRSVLSHVLMPEGFAVDLCLKDYVTSSYLKEADVGDSGNGRGIVVPGAHAYDGSYTQLKLTWNNIEIEVESAACDGDLVLLVRRLAAPEYSPVLVAETGMLWNRNGCVSKHDDFIRAELPGRTVDVYTTGEHVYEPYAITKGPYLAVRLNELTGFSTGRRRDIVEIKKIIAGSRDSHNRSREKYGHLSEAYNAMQTCLAWDTVYDPLKDRVISTVSRRWNKGWSGYVLFCWDNYFAACMAAIDSKEIAYSNLIEITREKTSAGFVPNFASALGASSQDRSQPPVGSMALREVYRIYREKWIVELLFDDLMEWNDWYNENRQIAPGLLAWGSNPYKPVVGHSSEIVGCNERLGAALESGLDNSPMYDDMPFNTESHMMELADVSLTGLHIMDCHALCELAGVIGRSEQAAILKERATISENALQSLWHEEDGFFYNKRMDNGEWSKRISPTNFYALYSGTVTPGQCKRVVNDHFYNPDEFFGEYIMPSISRNDPAYPDNEYWRGRIWAPMNYLVYSALKKHGQAAAKDLAEKSEKLILKEWLLKGHVHENYNAETGEGCDVGSSDGFYHWGGLLSLIALIESGYVPDPALPL